MVVAEPAFLLALMLITSTIITNYVIGYMTTTR
jgi:hypothetical protein